MVWKPEGFGPAADCGCLLRRGGAEAVIDGEDGEAKAWMMGGGPLGGKPQQRHRIGAAGNGERHMARAQQG